MPDIAETIKDAVKQALRDREPAQVCAQHAGLMVALDAIKTDTAKIPQIAARLGEHLGEHKGRAEASGEHMGLAQAKVSKWGVYGRWMIVGATAVGAIWALSGLVGSSKDRHQEPPITRVELRTEISTAIHGGFSALLAELKKGP